MIDWLEISALMAASLSLGWIGRGLLLVTERRALAELDQRLEALERQQRAWSQELEDMLDEK